MMGYGTVTVRLCRTHTVISAVSRIWAGVKILGYAEGSSEMPRVPKEPYCDRRPSSLHDKTWCTWNFVDAKGDTTLPLVMIKYGCQ